MIKASEFGGSVDYTASFSVEDFILLYSPSSLMGLKKCLEIPWGMQ